MNCEDCNNKGWVRSYSYDSVNHPDGYYIQHCGSCNRFKTDQEVRDWLNESPRGDLRFVLPKEKD